jgi:F0F1-type ATP synthase assembly protein I
VFVPKDSGFRQFGKYYGLAFLVPVSILVGYTIGYFLDKAFGTQHLKVVFLFLGIASGMIELVRELTKDDAGK